MQTFLPYRDFCKCAEVLDRQRLGKQRAEAKMILEILLGRLSPWAHHPAVKMWNPYIQALALYGEQMCIAWRQRCYIDNLLPFFSNVWNSYPLGKISWPEWLGNEQLHSSHRAALLAKNPDWYGQFHWVEEPKISYYWPTKDCHERISERALPS